MNRRQAEGWSNVWREIWMGGCNNYQLSDRQIDRQTYTNGDEMTDGWIVRLGGWGGGLPRMTERWSQVLEEWPWR